MAINISGLLGQAQASASARTKAYNEGLKSLQEIVDLYATGGEAQSAGEKVLSAGKKKSLSGVAQRMVSSGLSNTSFAPGYDLAYEAEVGTPFRLGMMEQAANAKQNLASYRLNRPDATSQMLPIYQLAASMQAQQDQMRYMRQQQQPKQSATPYQQPRASSTPQYSSVPGYTSSGSSGLSGLEALRSRYAKLASGSDNTSTQAATTSPYYQQYANTLQKTQGSNVVRATASEYSTVSDRLQKMYPQMYGTGSSKYWGG